MKCYHVKFKIKPTLYNSAKVKNKSLNFNITQFLRFHETSAHTYVANMLVQMFPECRASIFVHEPFLGMSSKKCPRRCSANEVNRFERNCLLAVAFSDPSPHHFSEKLLQESMLTLTIARRRRWRVSFIFYVLICIIYSTKIVHTSRPEPWWRVLWPRHISKHNFVVMERERGWSGKGKHIECYKKVWWFYAIHQLFRSLTLSTTLHT